MAGAVPASKAKSAKASSAASTTAKANSAESTTKSQQFLDKAKTVTDFSVDMLKSTLTSQSDADTEILEALSGEGIDRKDPKQSATELSKGGIFTTERSEALKKHIDSVKPASVGQLDNIPPPKLTTPSPPLLTPSSTSAPNALDAISGKSSSKRTQKETAARSNLSVKSDVRDSQAAVDDTKGIDDIDGEYGSIINNAVKDAVRTLFDAEVKIRIAEIERRLDTWEGTVKKLTADEKDTFKESIDELSSKVNMQAAKMEHIQDIAQRISADTIPIVQAALAKVEQHSTLESQGKEKDEQMADFERQKAEMLAYIETLKRDTKKLEEHDLPAPVRIPVPEPTTYPTQSKKKKSIWDSYR